MSRTAKKSPEEFEVRTPSYISNFKFFSTQLVYFDRRHIFAAASSEIDVFGPFWSVALVNVPADRLAVHRLGQAIPIVGPTTLFLPPFSIIDWRLAAGTITWSAYLSNAKLPADLPVRATAFRGLLQGPPTTPSEIFAQLSRMDPLFSIDKQESDNPTALRLKEKIDGSFTTTKSIFQMATELRISHASMTRSFSKTFGVSPVGYRNRMRIFEAMRMILMEDERAITACHRVGFSDVSRFNKWFRRQMIAVPTQFRVNRKARATEPLSESTP